MAVTDYSGLTITSPQTGIQFTKVTDSSSDWPSIANSTYFYDKTNKLVYFKNSGGTVVSPYDGGSDYIRRHETTANYDYLGYALVGTSESATTWNLTRLTLDSSGTSAVMRAIGSWTNRATATYA